MWIRTTVIFIFIEVKRRSHHRLFSIVFDAKSLASFRLCLDCLEPFAVYRGVLDSAPSTCILRNYLNPGLLISPA